MRNMIRLVMVLLMGMAWSASALVKVATPVSELWGTARVVVVGTIASVNPNGNVIAKVRTLKGESIGEVLKLKVEMPEVVKELKEGGAVVMFLARREKYLHMGDGWFLPVAAGEGAANLFAVRQSAVDNLRQSYPGSSAALVKIVEELKANDGKYSMLNEVSPAMFKGGVKAVGEMEAGITSLETVRDGKKQRVMTTGPGGPKAYTVEGGALKAGGDALAMGRADWVGVMEMDGKKVAVNLSRSGEVTVDGKPGKALWTGAEAVAAAIGNFGEDGSAAAIVVTEDQIMRYALEGAGAPADFVRLTGEKVSTYHRDNPKWLAGATARALDCNGDGRMDVLINTPSGPMLLINRGFGCFFINADLGKVLKTEAGEAIPGKNPWTAVDVDGDGNDDLLFVAPNGVASAVLNPKPAK